MYPVVNDEKLICSKTLNREQGRCALNAHFIKFDLFFLLQKINNNNIFENLNSV